tara:strand:- start:923 stop:1423 length:501 start_codon:yes stop_codon:yes gene_type:complete
MIYVGIDPGLSGGISVFNTQEFMNDNREILFIPSGAYKMPRTEKDLSDFFGKLYEQAKRADWKIFAVIEKVNSMPGQGIASAWKFSGNYHGCRMAMICNDIPFDEVRPREWQKEFIPPKKKEESKVHHKNRLKAKAQQLFPHITVTHAIADALLIGEYLRRMKTQS